MVTKTLLATVSLAALIAAMPGSGSGGSGEALAADIYNGGMKDDVGYDEPRDIDFNGPYIAIGVGYTSSVAGIDFDGTRVGDLGATGVGATGRVGYDKRFGSFVLGAFGEVDYTARDFNGQDVDGIDLSFSGGGRAGVVFNRTLAYVNAGFTYAPLDVSGLDDASGPFVGGGLEAALRNGWTLTTEVRHTWLSADFEGAPNVEAEAEDWTGRLMISRHF